MTTNHPPRPALPALQYDQRELIAPDPRDELEYGLRDGFPDRRRLIEWYQHAIVRTLGAIAETWPARDLAASDTLLAACITGPEREMFDAEISPEEGATLRLLLEQTIVLPACNQAYNALRGAAGEYVDGEDDDFRDLDPDQQEHVAMRPAFEVADEQQAAALRELWGGFQSVPDLQTWLHSLDEPANGAIPEDLASRVVGTRSSRRYLLNRGVDDDRARVFREHFAATVLLPAFAEGIERMEAGELATRTGSGLTAAQG